MKNVPRPKRIGDTLKLAPAVRRIGPELVRLKYKLGSLGLWRTVHAIDHAQKEYVGDIVDGNQAAIRASRKGKP